MIRLDLHTHSVASPDGGLHTHHYRRALEAGELDAIAVTDHNRIDFATELQAELGPRIIVGEEISTPAGELIGLFLQAPIPAGLTPSEVVNLIHQQGGLVYVPHPFETVRSGLSAEALDAIAGQVDIIETWNGRTMQNRGQAATTWAEAHAVVGAASSDAHGPRGWGNTYSQLADLPTRHNLITLLQGASLQTGSVGLAGRLYPKLHRLRKLGLH